MLYGFRFRLCRLKPLIAANRSQMATAGMKQRGIRAVDLVIVTNFAAIAMVAVVIGPLENLTNCR